MVYADDVNLIDDDIRTIERNTDVPLKSCKDIGLAKHRENYMEVGCHWGIMANEHTRIGSNLHEKVTTSKYFDSLLTDQNSIHEKI